MYEYLIVPKVLDEVQKIYFTISDQKLKWKLRLALENIDESLPNEEILGNFNLTPIV